MEQKHIFSNRQLWKLLIPVMVEQLLTQLMGTIDSIMVSNVGPEAISAVSLVDSINILILQAFAALAAGGTILCSQYIGAKNQKSAENAANQLILSTLAISGSIMAVCLILRFPILKLAFGSVEPLVMEGAEQYFLYTAISFPFIALFSSGSAIYRAQENSRTPMIISVSSNVLNIVGNAFLIFGLHMGVAGAAIATMVSRMYCGILVMIMLRKKDQLVSVRNYRKIRWDGGTIKRVLGIGLPNGVENSMFQFGKVAIQSTVSTLGTIAIAAQAMTNLLEALNGMAVMGLGMGMMTVIGQCMGAGRKDEAVYYVKKLTIWAEWVMIANVAVIFALTKPITWIAGMESRSAQMCFEMMLAITIVKPIVWVLSFVPAYGMRAAGDVRFSMIATIASMWIFRVTIAVVLCRFTGIGPMGVWIAMFTDWTVRVFVFGWRFKSGKWLEHKVI